ncbi:MAG: carotenoid biosynthesis protein [Dehalococcoidia bacterium]
MEELTAMVTERPYVLAFLASFLVISGAERGWLRTAFWLASGTILGWLMEFSSTRNAFPFGMYDYHTEHFPDELFIGGVPLFASFSFAFLPYFAYSVACTLLSPLERRDGDIQREADPRIDNSLRVLALAALITTWVDLVIDPVALLGRHWFLGDLYSYEEDGFHFGVPLSNYAGWVLTALLVVFVNQRFDVWLRGRGVGPGGFYLPLKPLWAVGSVLGNFGFMLGITTYLIASDAAPDEPLGAVLLSGLALSALFVLFAGFMIRRGLAQGELASAPSAAT